ncbi:hypothetical protein [Flammeovirga aprica]|uniref:Uncharacterized protein n=1 Tax=Flammeovirga aprica JL-4 TaxID=694437 RepID=A0A7X9RWT8_9BACT|nr:hypothetical protein [Flammeovirga aprica]NME70144.1 hypothetical protein [Flammeovirga aprica JL-4]
MKNIITLALSIVLICIGFEGWSQITYFGEMQLAKLESWNGKGMQTTSPTGDGTAFKYTRGEGRSAGMMMKLPSKIDVSGDRKFEVTLYIPKPKKEKDKYRFNFTLRQDGEGGKGQMNRSFYIEKFDEWVTYKLDFAGDEAIKDYNVVILSCFANDMEGKAVGNDVYLKSITGPSIYSENVIFNARTNSEGDKVIMDIISKEDLKSKIKKAEFKVIKNGYKELEVSEVNFEKRRIVISLNEKIRHTDNIKLNYPKGKITDVGEKELKFFRNRKVVNKVPLVLQLFTDFAQNNPYVESFRSAGTGNWTSNVADPEKENQKVGKFVRGDALWDGIYIKLQQPIDMRVQKVFKLKIYVKNPGKEITNPSIDFLLQNKDSKLQMNAKAKVKQFDQWVEYTLDFRKQKPKASTYDRIGIMIASPDKDKDAVGIEYYFKDLEGAEYPDKVN